MNTSFEGAIRPWWVFHRARFRATSGRVCSSASSVFFEAQAFGVNEYPHRPRMCLDPPFGQLGWQTSQCERPSADARPHNQSALSPESVRGL
jgi:hypothetical protein